MATRLIFVSVPKTHPKTKSSQQRTPFSAVAAPRVLKISRLQASRILETIYEEETTISGEGIKGLADVIASASPLPLVPASFSLSNRSTCSCQLQINQLSKNSDNLRRAYGSN